MKPLFYFCLLFTCLTNNLFGQTDNLLKIRHVEPLYVDLIRDLGARKGEKEWNVGYSFNNLKDFYIHSGFIEYEFSPVNRLGLEVEIPFLFAQNRSNDVSVEIPKHRIEGIKMAAQYTFLVSKKMQTSMAIGYMNELKFHSFKTIHNNKTIIKGNEYSPFFIVAKRWGRQFHSLIYTGPQLNHLFETHSMDYSFAFNASVHYLFPNTQHFVGIELNHELNHDITETIVRPQAKLKVSNSLSLGLITGVPIHSESNKFSLMFRIIYEPKKRV